MSKQNAYLPVGMVFSTTQYFKNQLTEDKIKKEVRCVAIGPMFMPNFIKNLVFEVQWLCWFFME
jgi:hypothetical protein